MQIRRAIPADYPKIYTFVQTAFATAKVSDGTEQDFVHDLRIGKNFLPDLEFVAEINAEIVGHIMLTRCPIETQTKEVFTGVLVAPLAVALNYRDQGIGSRLMQHALTAAKKQKYTAAFLVGDPDYYQRFGFRKVTEFDIKNDSNIPDRFVQACELIPTALKDITGKIKIE